MPLYFFDVTDTGQTSRDDEGAEFATVEQARREALRALGGIARDVVGAIFDEVVGPHMIAMQRPQPDARAVRQP